MKIVTLTTDFGIKDWFVGAMKGVLLGINPKLTIVDITHEIPPGDRRAGAFVLDAFCRQFPRGTIHVVVVDPGVGSSRRAIAVEAGNAFFVGPDNGVLSWAWQGSRRWQGYELRHKKWFRPRVSATFHGRDIFAPVAGHISRGIALSKFGPALKECIELERPEPFREPSQWVGEVVYVDRFGNGITNLPAEWFDEVELERCWVRLPRSRRVRCAGYYDAVLPGQGVGLIGSTGFLEVAVNGGDAAHQFKLAAGTPVRVDLGHHRQKKR